MLVLFYKGFTRLQSRELDYVPSVGEEVLLEGDSYIVKSRVLNLDFKNVIINMEENK